MAHLTCDFSSEALRMVTSLRVVLPEQTDLKKVPVLYLLHGLYDNNSGFARYTSIERYVRPHQAALVIPEVQRSFYTDMAFGVDYFTYVSEELPRVCRSFFGLSSKRELNYLMGLSMGGYGAMKCAFAHPKRYAAVALLSAQTDITGRMQRADAEMKKELQAIFGMELQVQEKDDLRRLAQKADARHFPQIRMYCGEQDEMYAQNESYYRLLKRRRFPVTFSHWEGDHEWGFWDEAAKRAVAAFFGGKA